ncbi:hypothetical protein BDV95DRAFT_449 [Massariosphaeria phaeospora]|uniref:Uncharacterized protein n=1 Tax=Massariosphaeria phaeospora TaxID=100035 RepID=A0A7C8IHH9_9PLEO|nr:hypothetical protein BDV95DRAFT_449 [Massariosphaeria phaeospora]
MQAEPRVFKDSGLKRTVKIKIRGDVEKDIEERLVEVLFKEEQLCQRCAWCGEWEYSYASSTRHRRVREGKDGRPIYWCQVSQSFLDAQPAIEESLKFTYCRVAQGLQNRSHGTGGMRLKTYLTMSTSRSKPPEKVFAKLKLAAESLICFQHELKGCSFCGAALSKPWFSPPLGHLHL